MNRILTACCAIVLAAASCLQSQAQTINVLYTTDVHGHVFNHNFVKDAPSDFSLANAYAYISSVRDTSENVILLDNGDFLQGSPAIYYFNNLDTAGRHVMSRIFNFMKYDAITIGNHDIEAQHRVYDKFVREVDAPVLGANVKNTATGKPYFEPYTIVKRGGKRVAVIGFVTPYIPYWIPELYWSGMEFDDVIESARYWVKHVRETEKPDAVVLCIHGGFDYTYGNQTADTYKNENPGVLVGERVDGIDAILLGHDHKLANKNVVSPSGKTVPVIDAGVHSRNLGLVQLCFDKKGNVSTKSNLINLVNIAPSKDYAKQFTPQMLAVRAYSRKVVCELGNEVKSADCLFGSAPFVDVVHTVMLKSTGADISMCAPLLVDVDLEKGPLTVGNFFSLYRYENTLSVMSLTGEEVRKYMEYSYNLWVSNPKHTGHMLLLTHRGRLVNKYYNMDSAAGIIYTVDVTKPLGERVNIISMADGTPFDPAKTYKVALNSYRANGGGGHLINGVGIPFENLKDRLVSNNGKDIRALVIAELSNRAQKGGAVEMETLGQWKFVPEDVVAPFIEKDRKLFQK